ncbi:hypothetical protein DL93DRAFT_931788 [Clavulina sp. PMI_390]|nr:hypothetical protein DL93DRAFT_931788 [Clavulina sp. PMI_390]
MSNSNKTMIFPNVGMRSLSAVVHFVGTAILSVCLARRVAFEDLGTLRGWRRLTLARLAIILVFAFSLAFVMGTGILVHGVGLEYNGTSCSLGIFACIFLYAATKVLIYIFLSERVWLVWSNIAASKASLSALEARQPPQPARSHVTPEWRSNLSKRLKNHVYLMAILSVLGYPVILILMIIYRIAHFRSQDGVCVIGIGPDGTIPLLAYDAYLTIFLTTLFVWPLRFRKGMMSNALRRLTVRTLLASFAALTTSAANIAILTVMHGKQLGWVCLACCGTDVLINALVLDYVTETRLKKLAKSRTDRAWGANGEDTSSFPTGGGGNPKHISGLSGTHPRPPHPHQLGGTLDLGHNGGTLHSVELRSRNDADIKSAGLNFTVSSTTDDMKYPPTPPANQYNRQFHHHSHHVGEPCDCDLVDADVDLDTERLPASPWDPATSFAPQGPSPPRAMSPLSGTTAAGEFDRPRRVSIPAPAHISSRSAPATRVANPSQGGVKKGGSVSIPKPRPGVVLVTSTSETVIE